MYIHNVLLQYLNSDSVVFVDTVHRENEVSNSGTGEQPAAAADDEWGEAGRLARSAEAKRSRSPQQRRRCV